MGNKQAARKGIKKRSAFKGGTFFISEKQETYNPLNEIPTPNSFTPGPRSFLNTPSML
jgi:hypothetical protein